MLRVLERVLFLSVGSWKRLSLMRVTIYILMMRTESFSIKKKQKYSVCPAVFQENMKFRKVLKALGKIVSITARI